MIEQPALPHEDMAVYALEVTLSNKIANVNQPLYYYRKARSGAITFKIETFLNTHLSMQYLIDEFKNRNIFEENDFNSIDLENPIVCQLID